VLPDTFAVRIQVVLNSRLIADNKKKTFLAGATNWEFACFQCCPLLAFEKKMNDIAYKLYKAVLNT
jgi:hypothetical protein